MPRPIRSQLFRWQIFHEGTQAHTYLARSSHHRLTKIGIASNVQRRMDEFRVADFTIRAVYSVWAWKPFEKWLHWKFQDIRVNGEWFVLSTDHLNWITSGKALSSFLTECPPEVRRYFSMGRISDGTPAIMQDRPD